MDRRDFVKKTGQAAIVAATLSNPIASKASGMILGNAFSLRTPENILLLGAPGTELAWLHHFVRAQAKHENGSRFLSGNYFQTEQTFTSPFWSDSDPRKKLWMNNFSAPLTYSDPQKEIARRIDLLKQAMKYDSFVIRTYGSHLSKDVFEFVNDNFTIICIEKEDKLDQLLTFAITKIKNLSQISKSKIPVSIEANSLVMDKETFNQFVGHFEGYKVFLDFIRFKKQLTLTPDKLNNPGLLAQELGFKRASQLISNVLPLSFDRDNKLDYFANKDQILAWFKNSSIA
ncbi:MAG: hypothetical protein Fur0010_01530 [Bdellovibrio sp.]